LLKRPLVLCLGNEIVSDDGFGPEIALRLNAVGEDLGADILFAPVAGFQLLDLLNGRERVLIVDTIRTQDGKPGTLHFFPAGTLAPSRHLTTSHQISLPSALELGKLLGADMPTVVDVLAVEAQDLETLAEALTPPVRAALEEAEDRIRLWIKQHSEET
jgi:hydrogenase maturation protease